MHVVIDGIEKENIIYLMATLEQLEFQNKKQLFESYNLYYSDLTPTQLQAAHRSALRQLIEKFSSILELARQKKGETTK